MKKLIINAVLGTAALGLVACDNSPDEVNDSETTVIEAPADPAPMPTVTETSTTVIDGSDTDGQPNVEATMGPDPSATITTD